MVGISFNVWEFLFIKCFPLKKFVLVIYYACTHPWDFLQQLQSHVLLLQTIQCPQDISEAAVAQREPVSWWMSIMCVLNKSQELYSTLCILYAQNLSIVYMDSVLRWDTISWNLALSSMNLMLLIWPHSSTIISCTTTTYTDQQLQILFVKNSNTVRFKSNLKYVTSHASSLIRCNFLKWDDTKLFITVKTVTFFWTLCNILTLKTSTEWPAETYISNLQFHLEL